MLPAQSPFSCPFDGDTDTLKAKIRSTYIQSCFIKGSIYERGANYPYSMLRTWKSLLTLLDLKLYVPSWYCNFTLNQLVILYSYIGFVSIRFPFTHKFNFTSDFPFMYVYVAQPILKECDLKVFVSRPTKLTAFLTICENWYAVIISPPKWRN